jgi:hypothetical protein
MKLRVQVQQTWQRLSSRERKILRSYARGSLDAALQVRCRIVVALVQGSSPTEIIRSGMASSSLVHSVMPGLPREQGYRRPTWTQEVLIAAIATAATSAP